MDEIKTITMLFYEANKLLTVTSLYKWKQTTYTEKQQPTRVGQIQK